MTREIYVEKTIYFILLSKTVGSDFRFLVRHMEALLGFTLTNGEGNHRDENLDFKSPWASEVIYIYLDCLNVGGDYYN